QPPLQQHLFPNFGHPFPSFGEQRHHQAFSHEIHMGMTSSSPTMCLGLWLGHDVITMLFDDKDVQKDMKLVSYKIVNKVMNKSIVLMERGEVSEENAAKTTKKVFVTRATGKTGKRIVEQLLSRRFAVKAGVRDVEKAKTFFKDDPADVTEGPEKLAKAIGDDYEAVICATGFLLGFDLFAPWKTDNFGNPILLNGAAMGQILNPAYIFLNVYGLTLVANLQAEKTGINYTTVRPGGLKNDPPAGNIVMEPKDTLSAGSISRDQVAEVAVEALLHEESSFK
ncbi:unnamed protein product, partial [Thlaspi arvense]